MFHIDLHSYEHFEGRACISWSQQGNWTLKVCTFWNLLTGTNIIRVGNCAFWLPMRVKILHWRPEFHSWLPHFPIWRLKKKGQAPVGACLKKWISDPENKSPLYAWFLKLKLLWLSYSKRCPNQFHATLLIRYRLPYRSSITPHFGKLPYMHLFLIFIQTKFFREYVSVIKAKQEPSLGHAVFLLANTILSSLPQEFRHLHRALGEHLEQYWKDSQIESKIFISLCLLFRLLFSVSFFFFLESFVTLQIKLEWRLV